MNPMNLTNTAKTVITGALCMLGWGACADPTDKPTEVKDLRVLAVAADPPEVLFDRGTGWTAPQVTFSALVADPRGGMPATFQWRFCPVDSTEACTNFPALREQASAAMRPMLDVLFAQSAAGQSKAAPEQGIGVDSIETFPTAWPTDLFSYQLANSGLGLGRPRRAALNFWYFERAAWTATAEAPP